MTRIIAGEHRGRALKVPKSVTRPTSNKVREAIFSTVNHALAGLTDLRVLDLYAGSGAFAIEALSRGADEAIAIEIDSRASQTIKDNCETLKLTNLRIVTMDVQTALSGAPQFGKFDLVFIDPPYALEDSSITLLLESLVGGWLADGALVVVERAKDSKFVTPAELPEFARKVYGDTSVWYGQYED